VIAASESHPDCETDSSKHPTVQTGTLLNEGSSADVEELGAVEFALDRVADPVTELVVALDAVDVPLALDVGVMWDGVDVDVLV